MGWPLRQSSESRPCATSRSSWLVRLTPGPEVGVGVCPVGDHAPVHVVGHAVAGMVLTGGRGAKTGGRSLFEAEYTDMSMTAMTIAGIRIPDSTPRPAVPTCQANQRKDAA
jgi:hypothetical protein